MVLSFFGSSLRTGTNIIAIINSIAAICYICYYIWEYNVNYGISNEKSNSSIGLVQELEDLEIATDGVFLNYITLLFMIVGFTSLFASFGLKQATIHNATHKIFLWLLIGCVQFGTIVTIELVMLIKHTVFAQHYTIALAICFLILDAALVYQLLVVRAFYKEEKLVEETNYTRLTSQITSSQIREEGEFQNVDL